MPRGRVDLDLTDCARRLAASGYEIVSEAAVMLVVRKGVEITLYPHGRLLMHPVNDKDEAEGLARSLYSCLGM